MMTNIHVDQNNRIFDVLEMKQVNNDITHFLEMSNKVKILFRT